MKVLILMTEKDFHFKAFKQAFHEQGFKVGYANIKRVSLFSKTGKTEIRHPVIHFDSYDAVYLTPALQLKQFIEPLLLELQDLGIYAQFNPNSFYINDNEALQAVLLNSFNVKLGKTILVGQPTKIIPATRHMSYPVLLKLFKNQKKNFSLLVESQRSLQSLSKSLDPDLDAVFVKEFIEGDIDHCLVIGEKVYAIRRKWDGEQVVHLNKGQMTKLSKIDSDTAIQAAQICGCDIATVKLCKGYVIKVDSHVDIQAFNKKIGLNFYAEVAKLYFEKIKNQKPRGKKE
ncbi:MAG: hypothetical protein Q7S92_04970 [Candidatus Diapherotrites archaeon]|nr:hypothetical protein [Candidatus Diapherotrites archaeon]